MFQLSWNSHDLAQDSLKQPQWINNICFGNEIWKHWKFTDWQAKTTPSPRHNTKRPTHIHDGLRRTPGLRRNFAVSLNDLKLIGYFVNGYTTPDRKWWLHTQRLILIECGIIIPVCRVKYQLPYSLVDISLKQRRSHRSHVCTVACTKILRKARSSIPQLEIKNKKYLIKTKNKK